LIVCILHVYRAYVLNTIVFLLSYRVYQDLKPANLLISSEGVLKIADFSLSRLLLTTDVADDGNRCYTGQVATRRYRAPELLFGSVHYDQSIDMWSVGCILAEMQMKTPLFSVCLFFSNT